MIPVGQPDQSLPPRDLTTPTLGTPTRDPKVGARLTKILWDRVALTLPRVTTGAGGASQTSRQTVISQWASKSQWTPMSQLAHVRQTLGFVKAGLARDERPVLVFFHFSHRDVRHGESMNKLCGRVLDNEILARRALQYRTVLVEMDRSDPKLAALVGASDAPRFVVLNKAMQVVTHFDDAKSSSKLARQLGAAFAKHFPAAQARLETDIRAQEQHLAAAERLAKLDRTEQALHFVNRVRFSNVRVDPVYDKAVSLGLRLDRTLAKRDAR